MTVFRDLHVAGIFVMPNPWDVGSAKMLASLGYPALATTSSGHAAALGKKDQEVTLDELVAHATALAQAVDVPLNVDAEYCFSAETAGIGAVVRRLASTGAAGLSIEDFNPFSGAIDSIEVAAARVAAAAGAAHEQDLVLTARAENLLYGVPDLDDTIKRLIAYREAGADVLYAPGLVDLSQIATVVSEVNAPVNVLRLPTGPSISELAGAGVRRVSIGGALAHAAYRELRRLATELLAEAEST